MLWKPEEGVSRLRNSRKIERRHGIEYVNLLVKELHDADDTVQTVAHEVEVFGVVIDPFLRKNFHRIIQFKKDLFEPQFIRLVDHDKKHFIMRRFVFLFQNLPGTGHPALYRAAGTRRNTWAVFP
jgi:hypothetical protein